MEVYRRWMIDLNSDIVSIYLSTVHDLLGHLRVVLIPKLYNTRFVLILNLHMSGSDRTVWPKDLIQLRVCEARWELPN